jgi:nicotinamide riboside kinase
MTGGKSCGLATAAEWIARQLIEAFGWEYAPKYFIRDRDRAYGEVFTDAFARWAYVTGQRRRDRHGRMDMLNG